MEEVNGEDAINLDISGLQRARYGSSALNLNDVISTKFCSVKFSNRLIDSLT